jgi:beta-phosphoglucomutase family hydrolase
LDGVLTDTAEVHSAAWKQMFDEYLAGRGTFEEKDYLAYVDGKRREDGVRSFLQSRGITLPDGTPDDPPGAETVYGLGNRKNALVLKVMDEMGVKTFDGSISYVRAVRAAGFRTAVVSSSANTRQVLERVGITDLFDARVDGVTAAEQGLASKPDPAMFLAGAAALDVPAAQAVVFEDALAGVQAGRAGGFALVVGVDRVGGDHADGLREHGADIVVTDLSELK